MFCCTKSELYYQKKALIKACKAGNLAEVQALCLSKEIRDYVKDNNKVVCAVDRERHPRLNYYIMWMAFGVWVQTKSSSIVTKV